MRGSSSRGDWLVVATLDAAGRWRDGSTVLVLAADHGDLQLEHQLFYKMLAYDGSSRVPLVFASPALAGLGAKTVAQPAQLLDIFPTLLGLANGSVPSYADGFSLEPFFRAGVEHDDARPPFVVVQNADTDQSMAWFAVVNGSHKLVQYGTGSQVPPQLFDLITDPGLRARARRCARLLCRLERARSGECASSPLTPLPRPLSAAAPESPAPRKAK